ncbi:MAG: ABC transporter permease [Candidatus Caenarcaniphilales bacterium]|jgi:oligopeptide transport system permease protein|nr:ABC transporter permease [Candidatus Caenarcaniphilales bacterium]
MASNIKINKFKVNAIEKLFLLIVFLVLLYCCGINFSPYKFDQVNVMEILQGPSIKHWFGTDPLGRDLYTRIIHGATMSFGIGLATAFNALVIGVTLGAVAGYAGKWVDEVITKFIDFIYSLPDLLVLSLIALAFSRSTSGIVWGLAFINWMDLARLVRVETQRIKQEEFIQAAKALGLNHWQIILKHILPNASNQILLSLSFIIPRAILSESTLSFIGLGLSPPDTSWGTLAGDAWQYLRINPHLIFFPALMIFITVYVMNIWAFRAKSFLQS